MAKPVLLSVDDDPDVLRAIERDLRSKFCQARLESSNHAVAALPNARLAFSNMTNRNPATKDLSTEGRTSAGTRIAASLMRCASICCRVSELMFKFARSRLR